MSADPLMDMLRAWQRDRCYCLGVSNGVHRPDCAMNALTDGDLEELAYRIDDYVDNVVDDAVDEALKEREEDTHHETSPGQTSDTRDASAGVRGAGEAPAPHDGQHEEAYGADDGKAGA